MRSSTHPKIAILDATNSNKKRRKMLNEHFRKVNERFGTKFRVVWIESICNDDELIEKNIVSVKLKNPDYKNVDPHEAISDFRKRIENYKKQYETVEDSEGSYIKLIDTGSKVIGHKVQGFIPGRIMYFLMHLNIHTNTVFMTRHGESEYNVMGKIGGDAPLSENGQSYAGALAEFMVQQTEYRDGMKVWCSTLKRTMQTAAAFTNKQPMKWRALSEIEAGICDGLTYAEIKKKYPEEFAARARDKLCYRYPRGESYKDIIHRLEPVIFELEKESKPVLVIGHQAVLRCLYGYFMGIPQEKIPHLKFKLHEVTKLRPEAYGVEEEKFHFSVPTTDRLNLDDEQQMDAVAVELLNRQTTT